MPPTTSTPAVERADQVLPPVRRAVQPVLRKGHELQVDVAAHLLAHLEHRGDGVQMIGRRVDMAADRQQPIDTAQSQ
jgi:hypothetical protein